MINEKLVLFTSNPKSEGAKTEPSSSDYAYYGTIESIAEELGEVVKADRNLRDLDISSDIWTQEYLLEELGDLIFNISLFAAKRGITLEDIIEDNIRKVKSRN